MTHLWLRCLLLVPAAKPPARQHGPELQVEDEGVASEEADLLLQGSSLLSPGHLRTLQSQQLQTAAAALKAEMLIFLLPEISVGGVREEKKLDFAI